MSKRRDGNRPDGSSRASTRGDDLELVRAALGGDPAAIRGFVARMSCVPRMLGAQNRKLGRAATDAELEDLTQETLAAIWRKLERFDGRAALETWVHQFCYLELMRHLRRRGRLPRLLDDAIEGSALEPIEPERPPSFEFEGLLGALERLDEATAAIVRLKHFEDLTFDALAERLGIPPNTAKTRYYRGLRKLRDALGERKGEPEDRSEP